MPRAAAETPAAVRRRSGPLFGRAGETPPPTAAAADSASASPDVSPSPTPSSSPPAAAASASSPGSAFKGTDCFTTSIFDTTVCELATSRGRVSTGACSPALATTSACRPNLLCATDTSNNFVCMDRRDGLETGGVVLAILFGALVALALGALALLCCRDRRQQKRFAAKAEAVALARAHTRKQRAQQDARAPLMPQQERQQEGAPGSPNPFQDPNQP